jgi:hypothetical protein
MDQKESTLDQLNSLMSHPLRLLRQGGRFGLNVVTKAIPTILLFTFINLTAIVVAAVFLVGALRENWPEFTGVLFIALAGMAVAFYIVYQFVTAELSLAVYKLSTGYLHNFSDMVVTKVKQSAPTAAVDKVVNVRQMVGEAYSMVPVRLRKLVRFFMEQIPVVGIIAASRESIQKEDEQKASNRLYQTLNTSIVNALQRKIGQAKTILVLVINVILHGVIIYFMI